MGELEGPLGNRFFGPSETLRNGIKTEHLFCTFYSTAFKCPKASPSIISILASIVTMLVSIAVILTSIEPKVYSPAQYLQVL